MTLVEAPASGEEEGTREPAPPTEPARERVRRPSRQSFAGRVAVRVLTLLAVGTFGFVGYLLVLTPLEQDANQDVLYSQLRGPIAEGVPPYAGREEGEDGTQVREVPPIYDDGEDQRIPTGAPIAVLDVPDLGLRQVVVEGTSSADLRSGPGHRRNTPLPGQRGVSLIYGRATTFGGPFGDLPVLNRGDEISVVTFQGRFTYRVEGVRRDGDPTPDPQPVLAGGSRLTLVTAEGSNFLQPEHTVFVDAILQGSAQPAGFVPREIPHEEKALASDVPALVPLVLWLQGLALLVFAMAWARVRWGRWETYLVGLPAVLAALWYVYESLGRLLPNLA